MPTGDNGEFTWSVKTGATTAGGKIEDKIEFSYKPNEGSCKDVRLIQTVSWTAFDSSGAIVGEGPDNIYKPGVKHRFRHRKPSRITHGAKIWVVDHHACEADPYYNGNDKKDKASKGDATNRTPTKMSDRPSSDPASVNFPPNVSKITKSFETCAICVSTGQILDCVKWSSTSSRSPRDMGTITQPTTVGQPSEAHKKALKQFVKTHSRKKGSKTVWYCPQRKTTHGEIDTGFLEAWGEREDDENSYHHVVPEGSFGQADFVAPDAALLAIVQDPAHAGLKVTWAGDQDKSTSSILFAAAPPADLAAHTPRDDPRFANDFEQVVVVPAAASTLSRLAALEPTEGPILITAITDLTNPSGTTGIGTIDAARLDALVNPMAIDDTLSIDERDACAYLALNMGESETIDPSPKHDLPWLTVGALVLPAILIGIGIGLAV